MAILRIRLRIKNCPPCNDLNTWYLLNQQDLKDIGTFLADVKEKFCLQVDKLKCHLQGFFLPTWESIGIIRDEDEVVIEKYEGQDCFTSGMLLDYGSCDVRVGRNGIVESQESTDNVKELISSTKENDVLPLIPEELSLDKNVDENIKQKKRKRGVNHEGKINDEEVDKRFLGNGAKVKKKKNKEFVESHNKLEDKKVKKGKKKKSKVVNYEESQQRYVGLAEKDFCVEKAKPCDAKTEVVTSKKQKKDKKEIRNIPGNLIATSDLKSKNTQVADDRTNTKKSNVAKARIEKTAAKNANENDKKVSEMNHGKPFPKANDNNDNNSKKSNAKGIESKESSLQKLSTVEVSNKPAKYNGKSSSKLNMKSKFCGNHVHFDSDEEDESIKSDPISIGANCPISNSASYPISNVANGPNSNGPSCPFPNIANEASFTVVSSTSFWNSSNAMKCKTNTPLVSIDENIRKGKVSKTSFEKEFSSDTKSTTYTGAGGTVSGTNSNQAPLGLFGQNGKLDTNMEVQNFQERNYNALTPLQGAPRVRDKIAFKVLEMSLSYTPEISDYKEAVVQEVDNKGVVKILLADKSKGRKIGDGTLTRKFELESESECDDDGDEVLEVHWKELIDLKLL